ncbi:MAG: class I SAM-dependent methyltransferase [Chitinophagaceae bacterium]|nr:class I SAM-dependent methyltransferase [Chitinophagaceae bacterium]
MKDNFSANSDQYALFRPGYPKEIFDFLIPILSHRNRAWDVATGNGQLANMLAGYFEEVMATDISRNQLKHASQRSNIIYKVERAEKSSFKSASFDLITVAQAIHWFQFDKFYDEVKRTLKPDGIIAIIGYPLCHINVEVDALIRLFYNQKLHGCWDPERKYLDDLYTTIPFPFTELPTPSFEMEYKWKLDELTGFLNTWSGVQHYIRKHGNNPVIELRMQLEKIWPEQEKKQVHFPVILRVGRNL